MRHARYALALALCCAACDSCDEPEEPVSEVVTAGDPSVPPPETRLPSSRGDGAGCVAFCEKSLECAEREGRPIPPGAGDCEASCRPGGTHHAAPPAVWACADEPCGRAFAACSMRGMMEHMRESEVAVFPRSCEGLCNKAAWCAERTGEPRGPGEDDCEAACAPGGPYADLAPNVFRCVDVACGEQLRACRATGGPREPPGSP